MAKVFCALMTGQGGLTVDRLLSPPGGIERLAARIRAMTMLCEIYTWDQAHAIAEKIKTLPADMRVAIGGGSLGGNEAPRAAAYLKRPVDLLFGIQPSLYGARNIVPANVRRAICFPQHGAFAAFTLGQGLGSYSWERASAKTVLLTSPSHASHPGTNNEATQVAILSEIRKLI